MRTRKFFWKIYLTYFSIVLLTGFILSFLVHSQMRESLVGDLESSLLNKIHLISFQKNQWLKDGGNASESSSRVASVFGTEVSILDAKGNVVGASSERAVRKDVSDRPDVVAARVGKTSIATLFDGEAQQWVKYVSSPVKVDGKDLIIRLSVPMSDVEAKLSKMREALLIGILMAGLVSLIMGGIVASRITNPIEEITSVAQAMRRGDYGRRVHVRSTDEIGVLGETFNALGEELTNQIRSLSQEEMRLRTILSSMGEGVIAVDKTDRILFCNSSAQRILGFSEYEPGIKLWLVAQSHEIKILFEKARRNPNKTAKDEIIIRKSGKENTLYAVAKCIEGRGTQGVVLVLQDLTELRRLEGIRRDFVANVSHELKTPLTSIKGFVETLLDGAVHDEKYNIRFLNKIDSHVDRLYALVQDLLTLASIEGEKQAVKLVDVDVENVLREAVSSHAISAKKKGLQIRYLVSAQPFDVLADRKALGQIVDNLIENAIKYTPAPGNIIVKSYRDSRFGYFEIQDDGPGIAEEEKSRIFERFYRIDKARSPDVKGTGLGLSIVKHLVTSLKGEITLTSALEQGSCFTVKLPLANDVRGMTYSKVTDSDSSRVENPA